MKLLETLVEHLKNEPDFVADDGELKKWVVLHRAQNFDAELIELLLLQPELKAKFFVAVKGALVFNQNLFLQFLEQKNYLNDSYTQYKNKVGLTIGGKYLGQRNEVLLAWPYKDCVLEGGQSHEEQKRAEIFFNEILAQDEITQLLESKVLTDAGVYDKAGKHAFASFTRDAELNKNRGLREDTITDNLVIKGNNLLALHSLKKEFAGKIRLIVIDPPYNTENDSFMYNDSFTHSTWLTFMRNRLEVARALLSDDGAIYIQLDYNEAHYFKALMDEIFGRGNFQREIIWVLAGAAGYKSLANNYVRGHDTILYYTKSKDFLFNKEYLPYEDKHLKRFTKKDSDGRLYKPITKSKRLYLDEAKGVPVTDVWSDIASFQTIVNSPEITGFSTQKPEKLIERIIRSSSNEGDIVLDFFSGCGTTCATAHKLRRQYIGIEQMDAQMEIFLRRLKKVIGGEQGGISKKINWKGGGSFTYFEFKKHNQSFMEWIESAKNTNALLVIWEQMKEKSFLNYNVDIKKQEDHLEEFKTLPLDQQKRHLCELLDKNQLYVNLSSLEDGDFSCAEHEKRLTRDFYQIKDE